jgi:hypothetical protein
MQLESNHKVATSRPPLPGNHRAGPAMRKEATSLHTDGLRHFFFLTGAQSRNVFNASGGFIPSLESNWLLLTSLFHLSSTLAVQLNWHKRPTHQRDWARPWPSTKSQFYTSCDPNVIAFFWCNWRRTVIHIEIRIKDLPASDIRPPFWRRFQSNWPQFAFHIKRCQICHWFHRMHRQIEFN